MRRRTWSVVALALLAGCSHRTSIVGTWIREAPTGAMYPDNLWCYTTFSADGTFHSEQWMEGNDTPSFQWKGTYKFDHGHLTTDVPFCPGYYEAVSRTSAISLSGDTMTVSGDKQPWRFDKSSYPFVDHSRDFVGKWEDQRGRTLDVNADGTFALQLMLRPKPGSPLVAAKFEGTYGFAGYSPSQWHPFTLDGKLTLSGEEAHPPTHEELDLGPEPTPSGWLIHLNPPNDGSGIAAATYSRAGQQLGTPATAVGPRGSANPK